MREICDDLEAEQADLERVLSRLSAAQWEAQTPAPNWTVRDQVSHLGYFDRSGALAICNEAAFVEDAARLASAEKQTQERALIDQSLVQGRLATGEELLAWWLKGAAGVVSALRRLGPKDRLPWYGPSMGARSFATARLMETWAHGQDIADALEQKRIPTERLRHIAHLGIAARPYAYTVNGLTEAIG